MQAFSQQFRSFRDSFMDFATNQAQNANNLLTSRFPGVPTALMAQPGFEEAADLTVDPGKLRQQAIADVKSRLQAQMALQVQPAASVPRPAKAHKRGPPVLALTDRARPKAKKGGRVQFAVGARNWDDTWGEIRDQSDDEKQASSDKLTPSATPQSIPMSTETDETVIHGLSGTPDSQASSDEDSLPEGPGGLDETWASGAAVTNDPNVSVASFPGFRTIEEGQIKSEKEIKKQFDHMKKSLDGFLRETYLHGNTQAKEEEAMNLMKNRLLTYHQCRDDLTEYVQNAHQMFVRMQAVYGNMNFVGMVAAHANMRVEGMQTSAQQIETELKTLIANADQMYEREQRHAADIAEQRRAIYVEALGQAMRSMQPYDPQIGNGQPWDYNPSDSVDSTRAYPARGGYSARDPGANPRSAEPDDDDPQEPYYGQRRHMYRRAEHADNARRQNHRRKEMDRVQGRFETVSKRIDNLTQQIQAHMQNLDRWIRRLRDLYKMSNGILQHHRSVSQQELDTMNGDVMTSQTTFAPQIQGTLTADLLAYRELYHASGGPSVFAFVGMEMDAGARTQGLHVLYQRPGLQRANDFLGFSGLEIQRAADPQFYRATVEQAEIFRILEDVHQNEVHTLVDVANVLTVCYNIVETRGVYSGAQEEVTRTLDDLDTVRRLVVDSFQQFANKYETTVNSAGGFARYFGTDSDGTGGRLRTRYNDLHRLLTADDAKSGVYEQLAFIVRDQESLQQEKLANGWDAEPLPEQGTLVLPRTSKAQTQLMRHMETVLTQAESEFVERSRLAEAWHVLLAYYSRCITVVKGYLRCTTLLKDANNHLSSTVEAALFRAHAWMTATFGPQVPIPSVADMVTEYVGANASRQSEMYTSVRSKTALLAQIVGSLVIEMNLQHPNGASGGIYPQRVFQMDDQRMLARLDAAIQFLDGAQPLVLASHMPVQYMGRHGFSGSYVRHATLRR